MLAPLACPEIERWQALFDAAVPVDQWQCYEQHLESCPICQERLDRTETDESSLLSLLRQTGDQMSQRADPTLAQVLNRLREVKSPLRTPPLEPTDLYFLDATERPDILGMLGAYEVEGVIGQGGMGVVLKAFEPALHRIVAIKVLAPAVAGSATARQRFKREAQAAAAVCHDHIVTVHGVHEKDGLPYLVMQYIAGESLQARLDRMGPLEVTEIVRIGLQTASGLAAAHAQGLIHRDIKPANLLLEDGLARVRITDFGLARMIDDVPLTRNGELAGTPEYMAPEQARGEPVDHRADLFSLGSVLYALCTGRQPFRGNSIMAVLRQVSEETPPPIRSLNPDIPAWLEAFITRLMAKEPEERFQSAAEVAALLEAYLAHLRQPATVPTPMLPSQPNVRRHGKAWRRPQWLLAGALAMALGGSLLLLAAPIPEPPKGQQTPLPRTFYQDFRNGRTPTDPVQLAGPNADLFTRSENEGFRITLPAQRDSTSPIGVQVTAPVVGDFEITTGYELIDVGQPTTSSGMGVELYLMTDTPTQESVGLYRVVRPSGETVFVCIRMTGPRNKRRYISQSAPATNKSGQLRVTRTKDEVTFWAADGDGGEFRELWRSTLNTEDLIMVRMAAYPGQSQKEPVDVRIRDLRIGARELAIEQLIDSSMPSANPGGGTGKSWAIAGIVAALFIGGAVVCLFVVWRNRRLAAMAVPVVGFESKMDNLERTEASVVSFSCSSCGKNLKARSELAGKKVRCTQCAKPVLVPSIEAG